MTKPVVKRIACVMLLAALTGFAVKFKVENPNTRYRIRLLPASERRYGGSIWSDGLTCSEEERYYGYISFIRVDCL